MYYKLLIRIFSTSVRCNNILLSLKIESEVLMLQNNLGEKIRQLRKANGLTQEQLAEKVGIDNKHLSRIEKGRHMPTYRIIKKLADVLNIDIETLDENNTNEIVQPDKIYLKALHILNSAKSETEKKYYLEALQHAQKGLRLGSADKN